MNAVNSFDVTRNNTTVAFSPTDFTRGERKKEGIKYPSTGEITSETLDSFRAWLGEDNFFGLINAPWRTWQIGVFDAVLKNSPNGEFSETLAKQYLEELSTRGETIAEIDQKIAECSAKLQAFADRFQEASASGSMEKVMQITQEFTKLSEESKKLAVLRGSKQRVRKSKEDEDTDDATTPVAAQG